jgi:hypothetical protein
VKAVAVTEERVDESHGLTKDVPKEPTVVSTALYAP